MPHGETPEEEPIEAQLEAERSRMEQNLKELGDNSAEFESASPEKQGKILGIFKNPLEGFEDLSWKNAARMGGWFAFMAVLDTHNFPKDWEAMMATFGLVGTGYELMRTMPGVAWKVAKYLDKFYDWADKTGSGPIEDNKLDKWLVKKGFFEPLEDENNEDKEQKP